MRLRGAGEPQGLDAAWRQAQFASQSRLPWESSPVEDLHFTPASAAAFF